MYFNIDINIVAIHDHVGIVYFIASVKTYSFAYCCGKRIFILFCSALSKWKNSAINKCLGFYSKVFKKNCFTSHVMPSGAIPFQKIKENVDFSSFSYTIIAISLHFFSYFYSLYSFLEGEN